MAGIEKCTSGAAEILAAATATHWLEEHTEENEKCKDPNSRRQIELWTDYKSITEMDPWEQIPPPI